MICHGVLNMQETKYGVEPNEIILKTDMIHGFEAMCDVHETIKALAHCFCSCSIHVYSII